MSVFHWIIGNWSLLIPLIAILLFVGYVRYTLGVRMAVFVGILGGAIMAFLMGRKIERDNFNKKAQDIEEKREKAYEKIDSRNTDRDDVLERLRNGNY